MQPLITTLLYRQDAWFCESLTWRDRSLFNWPAQTYPSPSNPGSHSHTGRPALSRQLAFGPQVGEQPVTMAERLKQPFSTKFRNVPRTFTCLQGFVKSIVSQNFGENPPEFFWSDFCFSLLPEERFFFRFCREQWKVPTWKCKNEFARHSFALLYYTTSTSSTSTYN